MTCHHVDSCAVGSEVSKKIRPRFGFILAQTKALRPWGRVKPISPKSKKIKKANVIFVERERMVFT